MHVCIGSACLQPAISNSRRVVLRHSADQLPSSHSILTPAWRPGLNLVKLEQKQQAHYMKTYVRLWLVWLLALLWTPCCQGYVWCRADWSLWWREIARSNFLSCSVFVGTYRHFSLLDSKTKPSVSQFALIHINYIACKYYFVPRKKLLVSLFVCLFAWERPSSCDSIYWLLNTVWAHWRGLVPSWQWMCQPLGWYKLTVDVPTTRLI